MTKKKWQKLIRDICFILTLGVVSLALACTSTPAPAPSPTPTLVPAPKPTSPAASPTPTAATPAPKEAIKWTFATSSGASPNIWFSTPYPRFQEMVEKATGGRLKLETKVDLLPATEVVSGVIDGRVDIGFQRSAFVSGTFPLWDFSALPFYWEGAFEYEKAINDPKMVQIMDKSFGEKGLVKVFEAGGSTIDAIFGNKPIATVADFKGLKIRASGLLPTLTLKQLGAAPLTMAILELTEALQRGTVDAISTGADFGLGVGLMDVTKYISYWAVQSYYGGYVVVNAKSWNALPSDMQKILKDVGREMQSQVFFASDSTEKVAKMGVATKLKVTTPDKAEIQKAREISKPVIDEWVKVSGPYAQEVLTISAQYASGAKVMTPQLTGGAK